MVVKATSACNNYLKRDGILLNSFLVDVREKLISIPLNIQSTFVCSGNMNYESEWHISLEIYVTIKKLNKFLFYKSSNTVKDSVLFESKLGHMNVFNHRSHGFFSLVTNGLPDDSWGPTSIDHVLPDKQEALYLDNVHTLFMHQNMSYHAAHII